MNEITKGEDIPEFVFGAWNMEKGILFNTIKIYADAYITRAPSYIYNVIYPDEDIPEKPQLLLYFFRIKDVSVVSNSDIEFDTQWIGPFVSKLTKNDTTGKLDLEIITALPDGSSDINGYKIIPDCPISPSGFQNSEDPVLDIIGAKIKYEQLYSGDFWSCVVDPTDNTLSFSLNITLPNDRVINPTADGVKYCRNNNSNIGDCLPTNIYANMTENCLQPTCPSIDDDTWKKISIGMILIFVSYLIIKLLLWVFFRH
jgi:hypothetical protein|uniref:Uncharacterized protein n=1 Tax=viral metagenome TaxID=1070528 RepID=A0A6C0LVH0_9ZZZZ